MIEQNTNKQFCWLQQAASNILDCRYILLMTQFRMLYKGERCVSCRRRRHSLFCDTKNLPLCNVAPLIIINQQPPSTSHPMKYVTRDYQSSTADHCCCRAGSLTTTGWSTPSSASPSSTWPPASPWSSCTPGGWRGWSPGPHGPH